MRPIEPQVGTIASQLLSIPEIGFRGQECRPLAIGGNGADDKIAVFGHDQQIADIAMAPVEMGKRRERRDKGGKRFRFAIGDQVKLNLNPAIKMNSCE